MKRARSPIVTRSQKRAKIETEPEIEDKPELTSHCTTKEKVASDAITLASTTKRLDEIDDSGIRIFPYEPLGGPTSFRLLQILETPDGSTSIHLKITEFDRAHVSCPAYTALSYVWGNMRTLLPVHMNGRRVHITPNLHEALVHLRVVKPGPVYWWIDALCMNQQDTRERGHQVNQMRQIYSDAEEVVSWLGLGCGDTKKLFKLAQYRPTLLKLYLADIFYYTSTTAQNKILRACKYIVHHEYWRRIWVQQEVHAAKTLWLVCGHNIIRETQFRVFLVEANTWSVFQNPIVGIISQSLSRRHSTNTVPLSLSTALCESVFCSATDSRDKVYGILGLVNTGAGARITADYTYSPCFVYLLAIEAMLMDCKYHRDPEELIGGHNHFLKYAFAMVSSSCWTAFQHRQRSKLRLCDEMNTMEGNCDGMVCRSLSTMLRIADMTYGYFVFTG